MARFDYRHAIILSEDVDQIKYEMYRDVFYGNSSPTRIVVFSSSGIIDPFTEEVTYFQSNTYYNASGIISPIGENDELLGIAGRVKVGDSSVIYPYDLVSGLFLQSLIKEIEINVPGLSGLYYVSGQSVKAFSGHPIFVKFALTLDRNG